MALIDAATRNAPAREKVYRPADGGGMYLEVSPSQGKYWRLDDVAMGWLPRLPENRCTDHPN